MNRFASLGIKIGVMVAALCVPFAAIIITTECNANPYRNTYLAEFNRKYDRLVSTNELKIVIVGGSSLPFGIRSDLVDEAFPDYQVVNFGLYATLGTKFMMDMSKANIREGDVVILAPELAAQTYSLYFNPEAVLQACDGFAKEYSNLSLEDNLRLFYNYFDFARKKFDYTINGNIPDPIGIYRFDSFNEYGDIKVERPSNIMNNGFDSTTPIEMTDALLTQDFIDYVNRYTEFVRSRGAKIYFNFSPCNQLALRSSEKTRAEFQKQVGRKVHCDLLTNIEDCILDYRYFYDTNFHLNSTGAEYFTSIFIRDLATKLGDGGEGDIDVPTPPEVSEDSVIEPEPIGSGEVDFDSYRGEPNNAFVDCFEYKLVGSSYRIVGVKPEYRKMISCILPSTFQGKNITYVAENALYGCTELTSLYCGLTYRGFDANCFYGCVSLKDIYLFEMDGNTISVPSTGFLNGTARDVRIHVPAGSNYTSGYIWLNYASYFVYEEEWK